ncbi:hypothetical protein CBS147343_9788 [Aspergillus niger]|nr:hypothetical protein CBS147343_9788 [Aspergillus niger]
MTASPSAAESIPEEIRAPEPKPINQTITQIRSLAAGAAGGVCAVVVGHPFDLVKVRLQTAEKGVYSGAIDVVKRTVAREGLARGLYAGVSAPLVGVTPMFAVSFWGYDVGKTLVGKISEVRVENNTPQYTIGQISAAGFFSAIPMTLITAPFERVKVLLQIQGQNPPPPGQKPKYSGGLDVVRQLYQEGGIRSVFRGSAMTLARDGPGSAAYFAAYEYIKRTLTPKDAQGNVTGELSMPAVLAAGGAAGIAMWIPVFPVDTIKSRLQSAPGRPTIGGTIRTVYANGGFKAFFPGFGPALARAVPANAATFAGVELAHQYSGPLNHLEHATQIIVEATALLELDSTKRAKLPGTSLEAFLNSVINLAKKAREQPSGQEILGKLNSLQPIVEDIILIKNAVNNALASPAPVAPNAATRIASWADVVRSGAPSYPSTPNSRASTNRKC